MAHELIELLAPLAPDHRLLAVAVILDLICGDPVYAWHPVRLIGGALGGIEGRLRDSGLDGYAGGIVLFVALAAASIGVTSMIVLVGSHWSTFVGATLHGFLLYSFLALGDLFHHVWRIESAVRTNNLPAARQAVSALVGRDTNRLDAAACRRAAVESLSENLTDGFVSPVFWYVVAGLPGIVLFKVVSTMDSMVGYKSTRYLRFGWCGARLDDVMNYVPARLTWLVIVGIAAVLPAYSGRKAWTIGLRQYKLLLGPNAGWSEAATAGALRRQIVGPIWLGGAQVTDLWIGDPSDPPLATARDVDRAMFLAVVSGLAAALTAVIVISRVW